MGVAPLPTPTAKYQAQRVRLFRMQGVTLAWMATECVLALVAAARAHSPSMLAFGSDSLIELLSAATVLLPFFPALRISPQRATRAAGMLLLLLAVAVAAIAILGLVFNVRPQVTPLGIAISIAALVAMPALAAWKRSEARRTGNLSLAADAVQSATCAYLAAISLLGVAANAAFQVAWLDSAAALIAVPILLYEAREALRGQTCACH